MKTRTKSVIIPLIASMAVFFTSCNDVIFDTIREEVELSDAQLTGTVHSLVRVTDASTSKEYLFATTNPKVWYKDITEAAENGTDDDSDADGVTTSENGHWQAFERPGDKYVLLAANNAGEIYSRSVVIESVTDDGENEPKTCYLRWCDTNNSENGWQDVTYEDGSVVSATLASYSTKFVIFGTNTPQNEHRYAFANIAGTIYKLEGGIATKIEESDSDTYYFYPGTTDGTDSTTSIYSSAISVATFDGSKFYFSSSLAMTSNETASTDADYIYYADGKRIYYRTSSDSAWSNSYVSSISTVKQIAIAKNKILVGTTAGLDAVAFASDSDQAPGSSTASLNANASSTLSSSYIINQLLVADPSKSDSATDIYAASTFTGSSSSTSATRKNASMWAFYVNRGKWNRE